jgi:hypothetical protein
MICVSLPNDTFKYFNSNEYGSILKAQKMARKFVESLSP